MLHPIDWLRKTKWVIRQEIIWDRMIAANIRGWRFWQVDERIYWLYKPKNGNIIGEELLITLPARAIYSIMDEKRRAYNRPLLW